MMSTATVAEPIEILLVEDNPGDVRLTREALKDAKIANNFRSACDGEKALEHLRGDEPRPDLILLDLNLPRMDGRELLQEIKSDPQLRRIPVIVMSTSQAEEDIVRSYDLHANCFVSKPLNMDEFISVIQGMEQFWLTLVKLPPK